MTASDDKCSTVAVEVTKNHGDSENDVKVYNYDDAVELTGNGYYNYGLLAVCSIISNAVAVDMFGFGLTVAASACDLNLTTQQKGIISSMPFAGIIFLYPWGYFADTRGRRKAIIWSTSVGFIFAVLGSLSWTWYIMALFKFIGCSFSTASFSLTITLLGECTDSQHRGQYLQIMNSINVASEAVSFIFAKAILPLEFSYEIPWLNITYRPWRLLILVMAAPLALGAIMMWFFHESPKFIANLGEDVKCVDILNDIYEKNGGKRGDFPVKKIQCNVDSTQRAKDSIWKSLWIQTAPIFKPPLLWRTLQLYYLLIIICTTNNVFVMWFPTMVNSFFLSFNDDSNNNSEGFCDKIVTNVTSSNGHDNNFSCNDTISDNTLWAGIIYGLFFTVLNLLISRLVSRKRVVLLTTLIVCGICGVMVNLIPQPIVSMLMYVLLQGTSLGIGIAASYFVDLYPTSYRGMVASLGFMAARGSTFAGVNLLGAVFNSYCALTFYLWSLYVFSGAVISYFLPLDTKTSK